MLLYSLTNQREFCNYKATIVILKNLLNIVWQMLKVLYYNLIKAINPQQLRNSFILMLQHGKF